MTAMLIVFGVLFLMSLLPEANLPGLYKNKLVYKIMSPVCSQKL